MQGLNFTSQLSHAVEWKNNNFLTCVFLYSYRNCNLPKLRHKRKLLHSKLRYLNLKESCSQHNKCPQQGGKDFEESKI